MKKTLAMLMTATMVLSMGVGASAAENGYSISLQNNKLTLSSSEKTVTYQLEEDEILLGQSAAGGIAVSFLDKEDGSKKVSLGEQKQVTVTGDIDRLRISKTLDQEYSIIWTRMQMLKLCSPTVMQESWWTARSPRHT